MWGDRGGEKRRVRNERGVNVSSWKHWGGEGVKRRDINNTRGRGWDDPFRGFFNPYVETVASFRGWVVHLRGLADSSGFRSLNWIVVVNLIYRVKRGKHFGMGSASVGRVRCNERFFLSIWPGVEFVSGKEPEGLNWYSLAQRK